MSAALQDLDVRAADLFHAALDEAERLHRTPLSQDVARLSKLFGADKAERDPAYLTDPGLRRAYLGFYAPRNAVRLALLLRSLERERALKRLSAPRVLDVGAGPLAGLLGAWVRYGELREATAVDLAAGAMRDGRDMYARVVGSAAPAPQTRVANITSRPWPTLPRADLVMVANVIGELGDARRATARRAQVVEDALAQTTDEGAVLVVEPATRVHARGLMAVRDLLVERGHVVRAPCTGADACPLLLTRGDWCHEDLAWTPPPRVARLMRDAGLRPAPLRHAYLLLTRARPGRGQRVVSGVLRRGRRRVQLSCTPDGLVELDAKRTRRRGEKLRGQAGAPSADVGSRASSSRKGRGAGADVSRASGPTASRKPPRKDSPSSSRTRRRSPDAPRK